MKLSKQNKTDLLEIAIVLAMFFLIIVIYVPVAIWEEEEYFQDESRYRMQNLYDIEVFYSQLTGEYNPNFLEAMTLVNSTRDSTVADSLFIGEQKIYFNDKEFLVDVTESFTFEFDTTFGFKSFRRDTVLDTTLQIAVYMEDLGRNDTSFIRIKDLATYESNENFITIVKEEPMKRVEAIEYYKTYLPDSSTYYCPLTNNPYQLEISEDGTGIQVSSPITEIIIEPRYLLFSFNAISHGLIKDGQKSWD
ncbi:MAG: hypothetical protein HOM78_03235 [Candidatus Marinimicrobia bacterium]|jgi:hypothetical protein|nr:hypothetical protein [Candidatus Neomarinimicrobiota bacterium]MBT4956785.1 hypothetical protein [Candidatus Neomarinimicrobiota bacterium]